MQNFLPCKINAQPQYNAILNAASETAWCLYMCHCYTNFGRTTKNYPLDTHLFKNNDIENDSLNLKISDMSPSLDSLSLYPNLSQ